MRHRNLEVDEIRTLVSESRVVENTDARMAAFLERVNTLVNARFSNHKRLTGQQLKAIYDECMELVGKDLVVLDGVFTEVSATLSRPKGEVYEMRFVSFMRMPNPPGDNDHLYQLFSFRLRLSRRSVDLDFQWHPVAFSYHATERLVERSTEKVEAMKRIASELAASLELIVCGEKLAVERNGGRFHVPFADASGCLLGEYVPFDLAAVKSTAFRRKCSQEKLHGVPTERLYVARTFVDRYQLEPVQAYAMNLLSLWKKEGGEGYRKANATRCWTEGEGLAVRTSLDPRPGDIKMIELIFDDPSFARAHCRGKPDDTHAQDYLLPLGRWRVRDEELRPVPAPVAEQSMAAACAA